MWWRLELLLKGMAKQLVRGGARGVGAPEIVLLHQALIRLERRIEVLESSDRVFVSADEGKESVI